MRPTSNFISALYPSFPPAVVDALSVQAWMADVTASAGGDAPRFQPFCAGSVLRGVPTGLPVVSVAYFHVPKMATGSYGVPPCCRSPLVHEESPVRSVT
jgi:hypothetical protein